ncbi:MAG: hypothetical protein V4590_04420 [Bacteroidota bacterium]
MTSQHTFHIPVLGLAYSIDTPVKVARFGISSVISVVQDELVEQMRHFHAVKNNIAFHPVFKTTFDYRAKRITEYLNLIKELVHKQIDILKQESYTAGTEITKYFTLLPDESVVKKLYFRMLQASGAAQVNLQNQLREHILPGSIDVNIMTKIDGHNYHSDMKNMDPELFSEALAALRGYANSTLESSVIFSAGLNPRLYSYLETFPDFFPDDEQRIRKRVIIKVSDFRSASIQGKFLAKKGVWVSEFRIESGLNCGGHAFATDGYLMGPVLEEFKEKQNELTRELRVLVNVALIGKKQPILAENENIRFTVQGGIGTASEDHFLRTHYCMDATGWGSPFLLVPEATNVDEETLKDLACATPDDYYLSGASPLGVPFNNFRKSSAEKQRMKRIESGKPGSPCMRKHLSFNTEFTPKTLCTASRKYQHLKIRELNTLALTPPVYKQKLADITEKDCLCEGLSAVGYQLNDPTQKLNMNAVTICPGPNLVYFSGIFKLNQMVDHIYGRASLLNSIERPHMFVNELKMYIDYLKKDLLKLTAPLTSKQVKYYTSFRQNLLSGIQYYKKLDPLKPWLSLLEHYELKLNKISLENPVLAYEN